METSTDGVEDPTGPSIKRRSGIQEVDGWEDALSIADATLPLSQYLGSMRG